ncbi:MAG TPA: hypothetical protein VE224_03980 [Pseudolabrys sp.]|jgi:hypothetical protein|nr:hypothetical protein [Pseudolabrys sp.]
MHSASAEPAAAGVFQRFNLLGTWAVDCRKPASPQNPFVSDMLQDGGAVVEEQHLGPDYAVNHYRVMAAEALSDKRVSLTVMFHPGTDDAQQQRLVVHVWDSHRRTLFNQPEGEAVLVNNGVVVGAGFKTPTLTKCK